MTQAFIAVITFFLIINKISGYDQCNSNAWLTIYCEDGYKCCEDRNSYWCCRSATHNCGNDYMSCKMAVWLIILIVAIISLSILSCVLIIIRRRRMQNQMRQQRQRQQEQLQNNPPLPPQGFYVYQEPQGQQIPIYYQGQGIPLQGQPVQGYPMQNMYVAQQANMGQQQQPQDVKNF